ncbi:MAG: hypothetical protein V9F04_13405 [Dermatophilaceae bacterium]
MSSTPLPPASSAARPSPAASARSPGSIVGALIMGVLNMGLSILGTNPALQNVIKGLVLLIAVAFDLVNKRRAAGA